MTDETGICAKKPEHPLGNSFPFLMFLAANAIWIVACSVVLPLASILITPENGDLAKMRLAALARILALPLFLPMATLARQLGPALESRTTEWQSLKLAGLVLPIVTIGSYALMAIFQLMASNSGVEHPLTQLFRSGRTMDVWIVIALVVVIAPVTEEVLFRGFFQAWIISARLGPLVGWCMALALVACFIPNQIYSPQADTQGTSKMFVYAQIAAYLLIGAALILLAGRFSHLAASAVAGAMVFSAVHAFAWPSPAGLLPLACGLVWLREKTGRLWPCMLVHAAFNGLGTLLMIVAH